MRAVPSAKKSVLSLLSLLFVFACGGEREDPSVAGSSTTTPELRGSFDRGADRDAIDELIDDWHAAAASANEARYFGHLTEDAVFLGTDATERWNPEQFLDYSHSHFERGRAWTFRSIRRDIMFAEDAPDLAWFDEDLDTEGLGPCRGSGVVRRVEGGQWKIAHYNLALTIPNERFPQVREALTVEATAPDAGVDR